MKPGNIIRRMLFAVLLLTAGIAEIAAGAIGAVLPLSIGVFFLFTLVLPWYKTGFLAIPAGILLDTAFGRNFPVSVPAFLALTLAAYSLRKPDFSEIPDIAESMLGAAAAAEGVYTLFGGGTVSELFLRWIFMSFWAGILTLVSVLVWKVSAQLLGIPSGFQTRLAIWQKHRRGKHFYGNTVK